MVNYQHPRVIKKIIQQFCLLIYTALAIVGCLYDDYEDDDNGSKKS